MKTFYYLPFIKVNYLLCLIFLLLITTPSKAQSITGLWGIDKVEVGIEELTPVAKWVRINENGTYQMGNGWLQNSEGTGLLMRKIWNILPLVQSG